MCTIWNDQEWLENSQPTTPNSRYTLADTRYSQAGEVARTYKEKDGTWWGVLPGEDNYSAFSRFMYNDPQAAALHYLTDHGYTLTENPAQAKAAPAMAFTLELTARPEFQGAELQFEPVN